MATRKTKTVETTEVVEAKETKVTKAKTAAKTTTSRKTAALYIEMAGRQMEIKDVQALVKEVKGATAAYLNADEAKLYIVDAEGETIVKELF